jgi:hypothetical protein
MGLEAASRLISGKLSADDPKQTFHVHPQHSRNNVA